MRVIQAMAGLKTCVVNQPGRTYRCDSMSRTPFAKTLPSGGRHPEIDIINLFVAFLNIHAKILLTASVASPIILAPERTPRQLRRGRIPGERSMLMTGTI